MRRRPTVQQRFMVGWAGLAIAFLSAMVLAIAAGKGQIPGLHGSRPSTASVACVAVGCARLGDRVTYVLSGVVTQVSSPQPGVVCVQVAAKKTGGDFCALTR